MAAFTFCAGRSEPDWHFPHAAIRPIIDRNAANCSHFKWSRTMSHYELMTIDDAANRLGISAYSLRQTANRLGLVVKIGRAVRIDAAMLPSLVEACRVKSGEGA